MDWESNISDRDTEQEAEVVARAASEGAAADQVLVQLGVGPKAPSGNVPANAPFAPAGQPTMATLPAAECTKRLSQAEIIIEQAKLYRAALEGGFFEPGSGIPAIVELVNNEYKTFSVQRLEVLLGMKTSEQAAYSDEDREALQFIKDLGPEGRAAIKMLANKIKGVSTVATSVTAEAPKTSKPSIRRVKAGPNGASPTTTATAPTVAAAPTVEKPKRKYQKTDNPNKLPMPTAEQEAMKYAMESAEYSKGKGVIVTVASAAAAKNSEGE